MATEKKSSGKKRKPAKKKVELKDLPKDEKQGDVSDADAEKVKGGLLTNGKHAWPARP
jgi:hypothetical protein